MKNAKNPRSFFRSLLFGLTMSMLVVSISGCTEEKSPDVANSSPANDKTPKYIFFFIGDGMASPQINLTQVALDDPNFRLVNGAITLGAMNLDQFPVVGMQTTHAEDRYITGSAASATALACGEKTSIGTIAKNSAHTLDLKTMAEMAKEKGMKVGIVSSVSIDHATPACFYAHANTRGEYYNIASQMDDSGFDYFGGGYAKGNFPSKGAGDIETQMNAAGYTLVDTYGALQGVPAGQKCWAWTGYDGSAALNYEIDRMGTNEISLAQFTQEGIRLLDNDNGFFMMVEGGKVDWACHANDAVSATHDMVAFDDAIGVALDFYNQHPDETLIVVTGDHECGGLSLGYAFTAYETAFNLLKHQDISYQSFTYSDVSFALAMEDVKAHFGLGDPTKDPAFALTSNDSTRLQTAWNDSKNGGFDRKEEEVYLKYGPYYDPFTVTVTHILNEKAGITWTSYSHTGVPVPVYAIGAGANMFDGSYDNTDVAKKIIAAGELN